MSLMAALGLPDGDNTVALKACSTCGKSEWQVKELKRYGEKLVCDECVGKTADVLENLQKHGKQYDVPDHD